MQTYADLSKEFLPSPTMDRVISYVQHNGKALDLGAGALRNSVYLLDKGFEVTAIDKEQVIQEIAQKLNNPRLRVYIEDMTKFKFPKSEFDLIIAVRSLPFIKKDEIFDVILAIKRALKSQGIFYATFFGDKDDWVGAEDKTFFSKQELENLFADMEVLHFKETEKDGTTIRKIKKHWHTFEVIARKM